MHPALHMAHAHCDLWPVPIVTHVAYYVLCCMACARCVKEFRVCGADCGFRNGCRPFVEVYVGEERILSTSQEYEKMRWEMLLRRSRSFSVQEH